VEIIRTTCITIQRLKWQNWDNSKERWGLKNFISLLDSIGKVVDLRLFKVFETNGLK